MFGCVCRSLLGALAMACVAAVSVTPSRAAEADAAMNVTGWANPPIGHLMFCKTFPDECVAHGARGPVILDAQLWADLQQVNLQVNRAITPDTDMDIYGKDEVWTLPTDRGDCEDYVLLKRKDLEARGWPTGALLIAVVFDEVGEGHAVLVVRTTSGDYALDNKTDQIKLWTETGYKFVKRESDTDPRKWVSVGDGRSMSRNTAAPN